MNRELTETIKAVLLWALSTVLLIAISAPRHSAEAAQPAQADLAATAVTQLKSVEPAQLVEAAVLLDVPLEPELINAVMTFCEQYNVPTELAFAVMEVESAYQAKAKSGSCVGLYQINTDYISVYEEALGVTNVLDAVQNIECGVWYLGQLLDKHGEANLALMHYNLGNKASKLWAQGVHSTEYTNKVNAAMQRIGA